MEGERKKTRSQTLRQHMISLLEEEGMSGRDLSKALGIRERAVYEHLAHAAKSVSRAGGQLVVLPFRCLSCGYVFKDRRRFSPPGRCPQCRKAHIERPVYRILRSSSGRSQQHSS
ncbi:MAG: transcriptional regulator [Deltaproteobacteria bacterium]|nr:transcriptional regulator [Deltaproteobacteria bacterium]MBW2017759.1 transcriptional regulator [Deltaproteobacteria bacterium]MBW2130411.1 transcriptional regulator [Deltaproteobacteria bacterium]MBW2302653.1 transcriptional regulator [Deltaproteobacteria bacterium]